MSFLDKLFGKGKDQAENMAPDQLKDKIPDEMPDQARDMAQKGQDEVMKQVPDNIENKLPDEIREPVGGRQGGADAPQAPESLEHAADQAKEQLPSIENQPPPAV